MDGCAVMNIAACRPGYWSRAARQRSFAPHVEPVLLPEYRVTRSHNAATTAAKRIGRLPKLRHHTTRTENENAKRTPYCTPACARTVNTAAMLSPSAIGSSQSSFHLRLWRRHRLPRYDGAQRAPQRSAQRKLNHVWRRPRGDQRIEDAPSTRQRYPKIELRQRLHQAGCGQVDVTHQGNANKISR